MGSLLDVDILPTSNFGAYITVLLFMEMPMFSHILVIIQSSVVCRDTQLSIANTVA